MKLKKCKFCGKEFEPRTTLQTFDRPKCHFDYLKEKEKKKFNKMKDSIRKRPLLVKKLDEVTSKIIRLRYQDKCVICGSSENNHPINFPTNGHLITRVKYIIRWDIREDGNCHCQCKNCNGLHETEPHHFTNWYIKTFGMKSYDELIEESKQETHYKDYDLEAMLEERKDILKEMKI